MKVYLLWENQEGCDDCSCPIPRRLVQIYKDKAQAEADAKGYWGGRVTEEEVQ